MLFALFFSAGKLSIVGQLENMTWTLDWTLDWTGLDWTGLDWTGLGVNFLELQIHSNTFRVFLLMAVHGKF